MHAKPTLLQHQNLLFYRAGIPECLTLYMFYGPYKVLVSYCVAEFDEHTLT
jgi:hypothetical protein